MIYNLNLQLLRVQSSRYLLQRSHYLVSPFSQDLPMAARNYCCKMLYTLSNYILYARNYFSYGHEWSNHEDMMIVQYCRAFVPHEKSYKKERLKFAGYCLTYKWSNLATKALAHQHSALQYSWLSTPDPSLAIPIYLYPCTYIYIGMISSTKTLLYTGLLYNKHYQHIYVTMWVYTLVVQHTDIRI